MDYGIPTPWLPTLAAHTGLDMKDLEGSVRFQGKQCSEHTPDHYKLYQAEGIRSCSAATRCTWMTRRRASETLWLMVLAGRQRVARMGLLL